MEEIKAKHSQKIIDFIHWVNAKGKFTFKEAYDSKGSWNKTSVGSMLTSLKKSGYLSSIERGKWKVDKICPDDACLSKQHFSGMF